MYRPLLYVTCAVLFASSGCALGMGPSTAATRPLLGQTMKNEDAKIYVPSSDQSNVPAGLVRVEQVKDGFAQVFNYVSITSALKKGSETPTVAGAEQASRNVLELDLVLSGRIPLPVGGVSVGAGRVMTLSFDDDTSISGLGIRASVAPIAQLSVDFAMSWVSGTYTPAMGTAMDISGTRTSLGATLLLWGYNQFRWGVAVAKAWTSTDVYESSGYTYTLVGTMY